jgi:hypothetical protein
LEESDPYLKVRLGSTSFSTRKRYHKKTSSPGFYEYFQFPATFPGDAILNIDVWDHDGLGGDLIGSTQIDVENRWFSPDFKKFNRTPVETRQLFLPGSSADAGSITLWVDILTAANGKHQPPVDISPLPLQEYELRAIVWSIKGCPEMDANGQTDIYAKVKCDTALKKPNQETDTHWFTNNGNGNFNWRFKWPLKMSVETIRWPRLSIQIFDKDLLFPDEQICYHTLKLDKLCQRVIKTGKPTYLTFADDKDFTLRKLTSVLTDAKLAKADTSIKMRVELVPKAYAEEHKVGYGRDSPNEYPFLPPPEGRFKFDLFSPLKMCYQICGPKWFWKSIMAFVLSAIISGICYMAPQIVAQVIVG